MLHVGVEEGREGGRELNWKPVCGADVVSFVGIVLSAKFIETR